MLIDTFQELKSRLLTVYGAYVVPKSEIRYTHSPGFTLIELIMILVLIAIVAVFVAPRLGDVTTTKAGAFRDKLRADIRYAQNLAMSQNLRYRVYFNTTPSPNPGYAVVNDANGDGWGVTGANEFVQDPAGGGSLSVALNAGNYVGITVSTPAGGFIEFNSLGVPTAAAILTITPGGQIVTITAQTGAVN
jgi:Tfp pilus assembly protein FimT